MAPALPAPNLRIFRMLRKKTLILVMLAVTLAVSGCKSAKERAEAHFASAKELLQKGDVDRAIVEFRNVFKLDPNSHDARMTFADLLEKRGDLAGAFGQYRQVIEQNPQDLPALKAAARIAANMSNWTEAAAQVKAGLALAPDDPELLAVKAATDYSAAITANDEAARKAAAAAAQAMIAKLPDDLLLRRVVIDSLMRDQDYDGAEREIDAAMQLAPKDKSFYGLKLSVLSARKDDAGIEAELKKMIAVFPDDPQMGLALVRWYVTHGELDQAEAYLQQAAAGPSTQAKLDLVGFLAKYRGPDAALAELDKIIAALPADQPTDQAAEPAAGQAGGKGAKAAAPAATVRTFRALRASILFDKGDRQKAIDEMKATLDGALETDETRRIKVALAKMQAQTGDMVSARALVEQVLAEDKGQLDAIKLKAGWLTQADSPDDAITLLRAALDAHPNDPEVMTLMAQAYERAGNHQLVGDMLSQAVQASNKAPDTSVRYAAFLVQDKKYLPAESVLVDALRLDPNNLQLLGPLGRLYVLMKDWPRATQVADKLDEIGTPEAKQAGEALRPAILAGQQNLDAAESYLQGLSAQGGSNAGPADIALLRAYLSSGDTAKAQELAQQMLAKDPANPQLRFIAATVQAASGDQAGAEAALRALVKDNPKWVPAWLSLINMFGAAGQEPEARSTLDAALQAAPDSPDLLSIRATFLERDGDVDGAIKIYDQLYQQNSGNLILANNLASLLASYHGKDPASLDRAYAIARRLQDTQVPAFQDTYGWITYLRGDPQGALSYMESAAKGLPKDPLTQFHLAEVYRALSRPDDAKAQYAKVVALVKPDDKRDFVETARSLMNGTPKPDAPKGG